MAQKQTSDANPEVKDTSAVVEGDTDAKGLSESQKKFGVSEAELHADVNVPAVASEPSTTFNERTGSKEPWMAYQDARDEAAAEDEKELRKQNSQPREEDQPHKTGAAQARKSADQVDSTKNTGTLRDAR